MWKVDKCRATTPSIGIACCIVLAAAALIVSPRVEAVDIDLFASGFSSSEATSANPTVLFVLDNNSNWASSNQGFEDDIAVPDYDLSNTGTAEVLAIREAVGSALGSGNTLNIGIMTFVTNGTGNDIGGEVIFDVAPIGPDHSANWAELQGVLNARLDNINSNDFKSSSNMPYGTLMWDAYNYLAGLEQSQGGSGTNTAANTRDPDAYVGGGTAAFISPLTEEALCSEVYVIFISNPQTDPYRDDGPSDTANTDALTDLYSEAGGAVPGLSGQDGGGVNPLPIRKFELLNAGYGAALGYTQQCYQNRNACTAALSTATDESEDIQGACYGQAEGTCECLNDSQNCGGGAGRKFAVLNNNPSTSADGSNLVASSGTWDAIGSPASAWYATDENVRSSSLRYSRNMDDWARFLHEEGVPLTTSEGDTVRFKVTTYTVDVFKDNEQEANSALLDGAAHHGGGERFEASSYQRLLDVFSNIFNDIIDVNTAFAAVSLPLSATNRNNAENRVFVGTFRPSQDRVPRWQGNLKEYRLALFQSSNSIELADANLRPAINALTGFARSCAQSYQTFDTSLATIHQSDPALGAITVDNYSGAATEVGPYFTNFDFDFESGGSCSDPGANELNSDAPDGPYVEKGGIAQRIRGQATRNVYIDGGVDTNTRTLLSASLSGSSCAGGDAWECYLVGEDPGFKGGDCDTVVDGACYQLDDDGATPVSIREPKPAAGRRPTIHGDVIHSRPLTVSYGRDSGGNKLGFRLFYGANDGLYRAVDMGTGAVAGGGEEVWALLSRDHVGRVERQYRNSPTISYTGLPGSLLDDINAEPKPYFFDGNTAAFTEYDSNGTLTRGWIYPTMRRGGRLVYGLDVGLSGGNIPTEPTIKWIKGCPADGSSCSTDWSEVGQTWSTPIAGYINGYVDSGGSSIPVLIMGGGWDSCLDPDLSGLNQDAENYIDNLKALLDDYPSNSPSCATGKHVYVINADTGTVVTKFETEGPVVAEVTGIDFDYDGASMPTFDIVYALDAIGNVYRLDFTVVGETGTPTGLSAASGVVGLGSSATNWHMEKIAETNAVGHRLLNKPVVAYGFSKNVAVLTFGTGDRERPLEVDYPYQQSISNRFYAYVDRPYQATTLFDLNVSSGGLSEITPSSAGGYSFDLDAAKGFYVELGGGDDRGEQVVNPSAIAGSSVFFNSFQPVGGPQSVCANLGKAKSYRVNLFAPDGFQEDEIDGGGIPIPPIVATVEDIPIVSCSGDSCSASEDEPVEKTVCIGCEGFDPIDVTPTASGTVREAYRVENIDRQ